MGCELLSKILSLTIEHNIHLHQILDGWVVNCFQKSYLWLLNTTAPGFKNFIIQLWIAFKNLIFDYWTQLLHCARISHLSCELLSKILSLTIEHNLTCWMSIVQTVVNCFQKSYLWLLNTTGTTEYQDTLELWIAFKNLIFDYWTQPREPTAPITQSCELLSKILSLTIEHNGSRRGWRQRTVVNCFQKSYLWLLNTTLFEKYRNIGLLWIAFKNLIFDYWTQPESVVWEFLVCCELLSKILSLTIEHNWFFVIGCVLVFYRWFQKNKKSGRNTGKWCLRYSFSEQFKLNIIGRWFLNLFFVKKFHWTELFICNWQNAHLTFGWKKRFYATDMHLGVFCTWTMTHIDGKLKHYEPVWN